MNRRQFLGTLTSALAAGLVIHIIGCTEADPLSSGTPVAPGNNGCPQPGHLAKAAADRTATTITSNHGHSAVVTTAQQDAGTPFNLSIQGTGNHDHTLSLTAQDLVDLKAGLQLVKTSSNVNGHTHTVTFAAVTTSIVRPC